MPADQKNKTDYKTLSNSKENGAEGSRDLATLKSARNGRKNVPAGDLQTFSNKKINTDSSAPEKMPDEFSLKGNPAEKSEKKTASENKKTVEPENLSFADQIKRRKEEKREKIDKDLLSSDPWLIRNGHTLTYVGLYLFSVLVLLRPYEIIPGLGFLSATAFYFALATLAIYIPAQLSSEGNLTILTTEVKCILALLVISVVTIPIAKNPGMAWEEFNNSFMKAVLIFIVMVNVLRTRKRLMGLMGLSLVIGVYLGYAAFGMYMRGEFTVEGYRVGVEIGGMFGNPNDMSIHLITMIPIAFALMLASKSKLMKLVYLAMIVVMICGNMVTYSRGGFLGLIAGSAVLAWKLGRRNRFLVSSVAIVVGTLITFLAPNNFGLRVLSIFIPILDEAGSSDQRKELLERSILVTLRNPWGVGIGNFPIFGVRNLVSHNAYTQVSSELGILGLAAYLIFIISPFRKLGAIERTLFKRDETGWFYYLSIGLQASIVGYLVSSFFASVAYNWFIYYLIAYAVAFRRIYALEKGIEGDVQAESLVEKFRSFRTA